MIEFWSSSCPSDAGYDARVTRSLRCPINLVTASNDAPDPVFPTHPALCSMTSAIRPSYIARDTRSTGQAVCRSRAERVGFAAPARGSTRTPSVVDSSVGCRTKDREPVPPTTEDTGLVNGSANRYALSARSSPYSQMTRCRSNGPITKIAPASAHKSRESFDGECALASIPHARASVLRDHRSALPPLTQPTGPEPCYTDVNRGSKLDRPAAVRMADQQRTARRRSHNLHWHGPTNVTRPGQPNTGTPPQSSVTATRAQSRIN